MWIVFIFNRYKSIYMHIFLSGLLPFRYSFLKFWENLCLKIVLCIWSWLTFLIVSGDIKYTIFMGFCFWHFFCHWLWLVEKKKLHDKIKILKGCVAVVFCYFTLSNQDYKWWWKSFFFGGYLYRKVLLNIFWKISCDFYVNIFNLFLLFPIKYVWCYSGMNFVSY